MRKLDAVFFENNMATVAQVKEAGFLYCSTGSGFFDKVFWRIRVENTGSMRTAFV